MSMRTGSVVAIAVLIVVVAVAGGYWWWTQGGALPDGSALSERSAEHDGSRPAADDPSGVAALAVGDSSVDAGAADSDPMAGDATGRAATLDPSGAEIGSMAEQDAAPDSGDAPAAEGAVVRDAGSGTAGAFSVEPAGVRDNDSGGSAARGMNQSAAQGTPDGDDERVTGQERIQGQVMLTDGTPVVGAAVTATSVRLFDADPFGAPSTSIARSDGRARSGSNGRFVITGLAAGDYQLTAQGPASVPTETVVVVRSGSQDVRLVLGQEVALWVDGYVATREGVPLGGVAVSISGQDVEAMSAADGTFAFSTQVHNHRPLSLKLTREGYEETRVSVDPALRTDHDMVAVTVQMDSATGSIRVAGMVRDETGRGLRGKTVYLSQGNTKYRATTGADGRFVIDEIRQEGSYVLSVPADGVHSGYQDLRFRITSAGVSDQDIVLTQVGAGVVHGQMLDSDGQPVTNFTLLVNSDGAPGETLTVTSDDQGLFVVPAVPEGKLRIQSQSFPRFVTSGLTITNGEILDVRTVLDLGGADLRGRVVDEAGAPVSGADVTMSWVRRDGGVVHESLRRTTTDRAGQFVFSELGAEARDLIVRAPNFEAARLGPVFPSGGESVDIQLQRATN